MENKVSNIKIDKVAFMINSGKIAHISAKIVNVTGKIKWKSDNESVAIVDQTGNVTAISKGDAIITASVDSLSATCHVSVDYQGQNPYLPPTWGLYICDPEPYVIDGRMYIYGSHDVPMSIERDDSLGYCAKDYHVIYSDDLINWTDAGVTLDIKDMPQNKGSRLWGPSNIFKSPTEENKYYFIANSEDYEAGMVLFESNLPVGPFVNPKIITMNGNILTNLDPGILADDNGKVYIAFPFDGYNFAIAQLDPNDYSKIMAETVVDVTDVFRHGNPEEWPDEGPSLKKRGNIYYYICILNNAPHNENRIPVKMAYLMSENPLGPWRYGGEIIDIYNYLDSSNIQGGFAEFKDKWYVSYHVPTPDASISRYNFLDEITFNEDGTINQIELTSSGVKGSFNTDEKIQASSGVHFSGERGDKRIQQRYIGNLSKWWLPDFKFIDYPETWYTEKGEFIGYRYMNFSSKIDTFQISIKNTADNGVLKIYMGSKKDLYNSNKNDHITNELIATVDIKNTKGKYEIFTVPASVKLDGEYSFYVQLETQPLSGSVYVEWMMFN